MEVVPSLALASCMEVEQRSGLRSSDDAYNAGMLDQGLIDDLTAHAVAVEEVRDGIRDGLLPDEIVRLSIDLRRAIENLIEDEE